jgi:hypothetical protein
MSQKKKPDMEKVKKLISPILFLAAVVIVAGPQIIDHFYPDFR